MFALKTGTVQGGDFSKNAIGTTGAQFLELPVGARAIAMGSAQGATVNDATALYYNPAGLAGISGGSLALMHAAYFQEISYQYVAVAQRLGGPGTLAVGIQYLSSGKLEEIDNSGTPTGGSFTPNDLAATIGYGHSLSNMDFGLSGKYIASKIHDSAKTAAVDLGLRLRLTKAAFSVSAANIGQGLRFREKQENLPTTLRGGSSVQLGNLLLAADVILPRGADMIFAGGAEYAIHFSDNFIVSGRAGYNRRAASSKLGGPAGLSAGGGVAMGGFSADYAWSPFGDLGDAHRISLTIKWGVSP
ncbi:MAG: hypothetical protein A3G41_06125 [Elusimicrobia bacterium RIFCSPLOWO2_12_FULL_59_9]|nr:MAG: hypothetical protein A3G41_06125 [Elusimicrobia bacterium RIFCSPLOWO2_12_FULL_59_9]